MCGAVTDQLIDSTARLVGASVRRAGFDTLVSFRSCLFARCESPLLKLKFPDESAPAGSPLPNYDSPPVVETSLGVQFEGLADFRTLKVASLWDKFRSQYPKLEEVEPLAPSFETFGHRSSAIIGPKFELMSMPPQPRFFFINENESELVQFQKDRLAFNWRRRGDAPYPRYTHIRERFEAAFAALTEWAAEEGLGTPEPNQSEAIYVNIVPLTDASGSDCGLSHYFPWLGNDLIGMTEDGLFQFRRRLENEGGDPVARLNFQLQYGTDEESARKARLHLHVRGRPTTNTFEDALALVDAGREIIVRTFAAITSAEAADIWERQE